MPYLWPKRLINHTLWGRTYLYIPYKEVPPPSTLREAIAPHWLKINPLAYGGCARNTSGSWNWAVQLKRHNDSLFLSSSFSKMLKLLWPLLILKSRTMGWFDEEHHIFFQMSITVFLPIDTRRTVYSTTKRRASCRKRARLIFGAELNLGGPYTNIT